MNGIRRLILCGLLLLQKSLSFSPMSHHYLRRASGPSSNSQARKWTSSFTTVKNSDIPTVDPDSYSVDVLICGAGPGGLLFAKELSMYHDIDILVVDPALNQPWPNNYGIWLDEADYFGYADCLEKIWNQAGVVFDEDTPELILERPYGRVDRKAMKSKLMKECKENGVKFEATRATAVQHFEDGPSIVTTLNAGLCQAKLVIDATGFSRSFVKHEEEFDPGYQVTYGARFRVKDLGPYTKERMVLMDYSERHLYESEELTKSNVRFPSFVYVMPLEENEIFLEETVLVSRPGASSRDLQERLKLRCRALGIQVEETLEDERAAIPMGGMDPQIPQRTIGFGATSSLVHPASGYMVARAMEVAPRVAKVVAIELQGLSTERLQKGDLDKVSEAAWNAVWPSDERRQRDFMHFGFELLCLLNPQELRDFFTGFFRLPNGLWEHFLSWRLSGIGHIVMGLQVWATCIPRRFMAPMLIKSLPFLGNRLVLPFATRGVPVYTDSLYFDARSGNATQWEPNPYYKYVDDLTRTEILQGDGVEREEQTSGLLRRITTAVLRK